MLQRTPTPASSRPLLCFREGKQSTLSHTHLTTPPSSPSHFFAHQQSKFEYRERETKGQKLTEKERESQNRERLTWREGEEHGETACDRKRGSKRGRTEKKEERRRGRKREHKKVEKRSAEMMRSFCENYNLAPKLFLQNCTWTQVKKEKRKQHNKIWKKKKKKKKNHKLN